jgi:hypothetical protein
MRFNLNTVSGTSFPLQAACFGLLRYFPIPVDTLMDCFRESDDDLVDEWEENNLFFDIESDDLESIDFIPSKDDHRNSKVGGISCLFKHMEATMADLPMFKGCYEVKPRAGLFRFYVRDYPADKILMGLMIARSACQHFLNYSHYQGYQTLIKRGHSPRVCLIGNMFSKGGGLGSADVFSLNGMSENAIFNPATFGLEGVIAFLRQDKGFDPFVQDPLRDGGYMRESNFQESKDFFNPRVPLYDDDNYNVMFGMESGEAYDCHGQGTKYRSLTDCFSIKEDYTHFTEEIESNCWGEYLTEKTIKEDSFLKLFDHLEYIRRGT